MKGQLAGSMLGVLAKLLGWVLAVKQKGFAARTSQRWFIPVLLLGALAVGSLLVGATIGGRLAGNPPTRGVAQAGLVTPSTSAATPTSSPAPSGTAIPSPTPTQSPSPTHPAASKAPVGQAPAAPPGVRSSSGTRGIFRFSSTDWPAIHAAGFNASTDGGVQDAGDAQAANGLAGMVWVAAYDNTSCAQTMSDSAIASLVQANVSAGHRGLRYQVGDEPTANGCNAGPTYAHITQLVHGVDGSAKTWVADDQFQEGNAVQQGVPMSGSVDILAFDIYPCESGPCDYATIDRAVQQIHTARVTNWEFIIQDFSSGPWRWPTPTEIQGQFEHWKGQGAIGYWVFAWDYQGQQVSGQPGNVAALLQINSQ